MYSKKSLRFMRRSLTASATVLSLSAMPMVERRFGKETEVVGAFIIKLCCAGRMG